MVTKTYSKYVLNCPIKEEVQAHKQPQASWGQLAVSHRGLEVPSQSWGNEAFS